MFSRLLAAVCLLAVQPGESANVAHSKSVHFRLQSHLHDYQKLNFTNPTKGEEFRKADQEAEEDFQSQMPSCGDGVRRKVLAREAAGSLLPDYRCSDRVPSGSGCSAAGDTCARWRYVFLLRSSVRLVSKEVWYEVPSAVPEEAVQSHLHVARRKEKTR